MGANLTTRDGLRFRAWQAGLLALLLAMALGMVRSGASWGSSAYDPATDQYSMPNITAADGAQSWWNAGFTGKGVDVAVIDTGVTPVAGLNGSGKVINGPDLSLESQNPSLQHLDTNGHGTFMAGLIAGNDGQPGGYRGVAPDARIVSVKVGVADGGVDVSQVVAAIDWVVQHRHDNGMNIRVINLSYGTDSTQSSTVDPLAYAVENAWRHGIVVVTSAGNEGSVGRLTDPAVDPYLLSVAALDNSDQPSGWNNPTVIASLIVAAVLLPLFVLIEKRQRAPMLDLTIFKNNLFAAASGAAFINGLSRFALMFIFVFYFQGPQGDTPIIAGLKLAPMAIAMLISSPLAGIAADRHGSRGLAAAGMVVTAVGLAL